MTFLRDALVALTYPLALTFVVLVVAFVVWRLQWQRTATALALAALAWTAVWSIPNNADWLRQSLADRHPIAQDLAALPQGDAIVVLGGGGYGWVERPGVTLDKLKYSRLAQAARLYFAGRAPRVILSGGGNGSHKEAFDMARGMEKLGVPHEAILLETRSTDTTGNAKYSVRLAREHGARRVLLVTSGVHMPRASLLFRREGVAVIEVPVAEPSPGGSWADRWLPNPRALWKAGRALKEYAGLLALCVEGKAA